MAKNPKWSKEEDEFLISSYKNESRESILSSLPLRNWQAITIRANRLGVYRLNYFREDEILFIKNNYNIMNSRKLAKSLNRSIGSIKNKMIELGIVRQKLWGDDELILLKSNFGKHDIEYISENILKNRTRSSIYHQCQLLGLSKEINRYNKNESLEMLKKLSVQLERTPLTSELSKYGLPTSGVYRKFFGTYNKACEIIGIDINATIFKQKGLYYSKKLDKCYSKAEQIITNFLIENNISYIMDKRYDSICKKGICGNKRYDWLLKEDIIVEYFGLNRNKKYQKRMNEKIELCRINDIELIQIFDKDILKLEIIFDRFL